MREALVFGKPIENKFLYLDIDNLKFYITKDIRDKIDIVYNVDEADYIINNQESVDYIINNQESVKPLLTIKDIAIYSSMSEVSVRRAIDKKSI